MSVEGFGDQVRRHRQAMGLTQEALAERSSLSVRGISDLERGLKQRPHPETVRLLAEALSLDAGALAEFRAAANPPAQVEPVAIPVPLTSLIGRDDELRAIGALFEPGSDVRLVTLTGPGGVGKTRLAIELATAARTKFEDGVAFAALAGLTDASQVLPALVAAFDIRDSSGRSPQDLIARQLQGKRALAVLDNMEHVLNAVPGIASLLERCPDLVVLATSRSPLQVAGERAYRIRPLALPVVSRQLTPESVGVSPAARLFIERASAAEPDFRLDANNAAAIADVCVRLDGLPLALELAAGRMNVLSPSELAAMLGRSLDLLTGGARTLPTRHQTVRATIAWSHDLLSEPERETFRRFAVFAGGATIEAVGAVIGDGDQVATLDRLAVLVGRSLVQRQEGAAGSTRFVMLETVREYALEQLAAIGEESNLRDRHATWFLEYAERAEEGLTGPDQPAWMKRLRDDDANLQAALAWTIDRADAISSQRLASALWLYWAASGRLREARDRLDRALFLSPEEITPERARALLRRGNVAIDLADYSTARTMYEASLANANSLGNEVARGRALLGLGLVLKCQGDNDGARAAYEATLGIWRELDRSRDAALTLQNLGMVAISKGEFDAAREALDGSLAIRQSLGDASGMAYAHLCRGILDRLIGNFSGSHYWLADALVEFRRGDDRLGMAFALKELGDLAHDLRDDVAALAYHFDALRERDDAGAIHSVVESIEGICAVAFARQQLELGVALFAAAKAWRMAHGAPWPLAVRNELTSEVELARAEMEPYAFAKAWRMGEDASLDEATAMAFTILV